MRNGRLPAEARNASSTVVAAPGEATAAAPREDHETNANYRLLRTQLPSDC